MSVNKYELYYKDVLIGILYDDTLLKKHNFCPNPEGIEKAGPNALLLNFMIDGTGGFVDPLPFFYTRIDNMRRWNLHEINYQTDYFTIKEIL